MCVVCVYVCVCVFVCLCVCVWVTVSGQGCPKREGGVGPNEETAYEGPLRGQFS